MTEKKVSALLCQEERYKPWDTQSGKTWILKQRQCGKIFVRALACIYEKIYSTIPYRT
jgi:hypothetical protein